MTVKRYTAKMTNDNVNPDNYQLIDFALQGTGTDAENAAVILAYIALIGGHFADHTNVTGMQVRAAGSAGALDIGWPTSAYDALVADAGTSVPAWSGYGEIPGASGVLTPLGTSVSVSLYTATPGPTGRGRHFLGFLGAQCVSAGGTFNPVNITETQDAYSLMFFGGGIGPSDPDPVITNSAMTTGHPVVSVKAQPILSNLESRRR